MSIRHALRGTYWLLSLVTRLLVASASHGSPLTALTAATNADAATTFVYDAGAYRYDLLKTVRGSHESLPSARIYAYDLSSNLTELPTREIAPVLAAKGGDDVVRLSTRESWGRLDTLADHFARHGADFGARTADEYARMSSAFLQRAQRQGLPTKIDARGTIRVYDRRTNTFGSYNASGTTKTFYKPDPAKHGYSSNEAYWNAQPGSAPWTP